MDAAALQRAISTLELRAEQLEGWLTLWIVLVVIGLLVEIYEVVQHHLGPDTPRQRSNWTLLQALTGPVLIALGVAGELGIHVKAGNVNTGLRNANREVVALLNKEAGLARQDAESARRDAGSFSARISEANARAEAARKDAAGALERAANAELRAAATNATAEKLRNDNLVLQTDVLKLRERLAGRRIPPAQHDQFVAALRPYRGSLVALTRLDDAEAAAFADDIVKVLTDAEWRINTTRIGLTTPTYGLQCVVNPESPAGAALAGALAALPTARVARDARLQGVIARIFVGLRPPP